MGRLTPVTQADIDADRIIFTGLAGLLPAIPVVTEEACETHAFCGAGRFILVDPLDGTREFTSGRDELTVNIALIDGGKEVAGAVYAPALNRLYVAGASAFRGEVGPAESVARPASDAVVEHQSRIERGPACGRQPLASGFRNQRLARHALDRRTALGRIVPEILRLIAEGEADVYPQLDPTMEWDTAAGHAVLAAAGGCVVGSTATARIRKKRGHRS